MKKSFVIALFAGLAFLAFSCAEPAAEETTLPVIESGDMVFHATFADPQTKTELYQDGDALKIYWAPNDKISVFYKGVETLKKNGGSDGFAANQLTAASPSADFFGTLPNVSTSTSTDEYLYAIYPFRGSGNYFFPDSAGAPAVKPQLNSTQNPAVENNVATNTVMVHVGRSDNTSIQMYNASSLFRFKITERNDIRRVDFSGNNNENICGPFSVHFDTDGRPIDYNTAGGKTSIYLGIKKDDSVILSKNPPDTLKYYHSLSKNVWYYLALLPTNFSAGATVTLYTPTSIGVRQIRAVTFERNHCRGAASIDDGVIFEPALKRPKITLNNTVITETTLWPKGTAALSVSLTGPLNNTLTLTDLGLTENDLQWTSSDPDVATVTAGVVSGIAAGETTITGTVTFEDVQFSASCTVNVTEAPSQLVAKPFYVDSLGTKVCFAAGNLFIDNSNGGASFGFNTFQGQMRDTTGWKQNIPAVRDLLMWGEIATNEVASEADTTQVYYPGFANPFTSINWNTPKTFTLDGYTWLPLTYEQWDYLLNKNAGVVKATVNGVKGLILLPSGFVAPAGISLSKGIKKSYSTNVFIGSVWSSLEQAGAIFLPEAGNRRDNGNPGTNGHYWSRTLKNSLTGSGIRFNFSEESTYLNTYGTIGQNWYASVRLVRFVTE